MPNSPYYHWSRGLCVPSTGWCSEASQSRHQSCCHCTRNAEDKRKTRFSQVHASDILTLHNQKLRYIFRIRRPRSRVPHGQHQSSQLADQSTVCRPYQEKSYDFDQGFPMIFTSKSGIALQGPEDVNVFKSLALSTMSRVGNRAVPRKTQRSLGASTMWGALEALAQPQVPMVK